MFSDKMRAVLLLVVATAAAAGCAKRAKTEAAASPYALKQQVRQADGDLEVAKAAAQPLLDELEDLANTIAASPHPSPQEMDHAKAVAADLKSTLGDLTARLEASRAKVDAMPDRVAAADVKAMGEELDAISKGIQTVPEKVEALRKRNENVNQVWDIHRLDMTQATADEIRAKLEADRVALKEQQDKQRNAEAAAEKKAEEDAVQRRQQYQALRKAGDADDHNQQGGQQHKH